MLFFESKDSFAISSAMTTAADAAPAPPSTAADPPGGISWQLEACEFSCPSLRVFEAAVELLRGGDSLRRAAGSQPRPLRPARLPALAAAAGEALRLALPISQAELQSKQEEAPRCVAKQIDLESDARSGREIPRQQQDVDGDNVAGPGCWCLNWLGVLYFQSVVDGLM